MKVQREMQMIMQGERKIICARKEEYTDFQTKRSVAKKDGVCNYFEQVW